MQCFVIVCSLITFTVASAVEIEGSGTEPDIGCECSRTFSPVCGNDHITYDNECLLQCRASSVDQDLTRVYKGACCPPNNCPVHKDLLCDNEGHTHLNDCVFEHVKCLVKKIDNKQIFVKHRGRCGSLESKVDECELITANKDCTHDLSHFVCDSNGITHSNICTFERINCEFRHAGEREITLIHFGPCGVNQSETNLGTGAANPHSSSTIARLASNEESVREPEKELLESSGFFFNERGDAGKISSLAFADGLLENSPSTPTADQAQASQPSATLEQSELSTVRIELPASPRTSSSTAANTSSPATHAAQRQIVIKAVKLPRPQMFARSSPRIAEVNSETRSEIARALADFQKSINVAPLIAFSRDAETEKPDAKVLETHVPPEGYDVSQPCSAAECDKRWSPVCDTAEVTHRNICNMEFHSCVTFRKRRTIVGLAHLGLCRNGENTCAFCHGPEDAVPACDNHNRTHLSLCSLASWNCEMRRVGKEIAVLVHLGACHERSLPFTIKEEKCPSICKRDYKPVCDRGQQTHLNLCAYQRQNCLLRKAGLEWKVNDLLSLDDCFAEEILDDDATVTAAAETSTIEPLVAVQHRGRFVCPEPVCPSNGQPVCDSLGNMHENICQFNWARCLAAQRGIVLSLQPDEFCYKAGCDLQCDGEDKPICGSDFATYKNLCNFRKARCSQPVLEQLFEGNCTLCFDKPCPELRQTAADSMFVCDENQVTRSKCEFDMLKCVLKQNFGHNLTMLHSGRCCPPASACPKDASPVCALDGTTFKNNCTLSAYQCIASRMNTSNPINFKHDGDCLESEKQRNQTERATFKSITSTPKLPGSDVEEARSEVTFSDTSLELDENADPSLDCPPKDCSKENEGPVCGSDGKTYESLCKMKAAICAGSAVTAVYGGSCCSAGCAGTFDPVCDTDGRTHHNLCSFGVHRCEQLRMLGRKVEVAFFAPCKGREEKLCGPNCPSTYHPVCAKNGETYSNNCMMEKQNCFVRHNITRGELNSIDYEGECCPRLECDTESYAPVCDSEEKTHSNECRFRSHECLVRRRFNRNVTLSYRGQCCHQQCEPIKSPLCDGKNTHENLCKFRVAQCFAERENVALTLAYLGECCVQPIGSCARTGPLCDSEGQTHSDACHFEWKKCVLERNELKTISIVHNGECCKIEQCHKEEKPVCDSRGGTHATFCHFQNTKCIHDKIHPNGTIHFAYEGACCPSNCSSLYDPVCDQHGSVYKNACWFRLKACQGKRRSGADLLQTPCPDRRVRHLSNSSNRESIPVH